MLSRIYARLLPVTGLPSDVVHAEAQAALVRAHRTHAEAQRREVKVANLSARLRVHAEVNHFGQMISESMGLDER